MREPIREPTPQEQRTGRPPEPLRYVGPAAAGEAAPYTVGGLVEWAPTWGGMFVALGVLFLLSALGVAIGVGAGATGVAIWEAISVIIAFFVGGWFAGRTLNLVDSLLAGAHGLLVWAVSMVFALTFLIAATLIGVTSFANLTRIPFIAGIIGVTGINVPTAAAATAAVTSSWVTFIFLLLAAAAAIVGALVGNQGRIVSAPGTPRR
ncbi:MAG TPA: hypothetical protein VFF52_14640 [Isosphaeraceae bacterium]|jgi:hypothetical protein|nr:hypothetical protein [Isosphaeraceae bacterium]